MARAIDVDDEVFHLLQAQAEPFVDTPNDVLRRVLGLDKAHNTDGSQAAGTRKSAEAKRAPSGALLPESEYEIPLLETLIELGGNALNHKVVDQLGTKLASKLTPLDHERLPTGGIRWRNRAAFVRLRLVERGDLAKGSPRGIWAISDQGRDRVARVRNTRRPGTARRKGT